jgi:putative oxidoreductase
MKIALIVVRTLMGLLLLFASIVFLFKIPMGKMPAMSADVQSYNAGLATVHMMNIVKVIELICGLLFVSGRFVTLANIVIFPIVINILLFHATLAPSGVPAAAFLFLGCLFLAYYYRRNYVPLFSVK